MSRQGSFIALEGIDGAGTTTQLPRLAAHLQHRGHTVWTTAEPSTNPTGLLLRKALRGAPPLSPAALGLLFAADRLEHLQCDIEPHLTLGHVVLCDRYVLSSHAYQGCHLPMEWVQAINARARAPDSTFFFRVSGATAALRRRHRGDAPEYFDDTALQTRIAALYEVALQSGRGGTIVTVDAEPGADAVTVAACGLLDTYFAKEAACANTLQIPPRRC